MTENLPQPTPQPEPLEIDPKLIQKLFDADPLTLSDPDYDVIIAWYRQERINYLQAPAEKAAKKTAAGPKGPKKDKIDAEMLGDLLAGI